MALRHRCGWWKWWWWFVPLARDFVDVPVPPMQEIMVDVIQLIPQERIPIGHC